MPTCHYHPNVETLVSCGRCGKPLCPNCVGHGATGVRCKECLRQSPQALGLATGRQIAQAAAAALIVSLALGGVFGFFLWMDVVAGLVMGFVVASALVPLSLLPESGMTLSRHLAQYGRAYLPPVVGAVIGAILRFRVW